MIFKINWIVHFTYFHTFQKIPKKSLKIVKSSNLGTKSLKMRELLQRQIAKLASGLLYSWSLLRNNNTVINLSMFSSSYGSRRFAACDQGLQLRVFSTQICFLVDLGVWVYLRKIAWNLCFLSDKLISNFNVFNNIEITSHYSVYMGTSGETVRISDGAERVQSVSYSHIRSLSGLYTVVFLREGKRGTCLGPGPSLQL